MGYLDIRQDFYKEWFEKSLKYDSFLKLGEDVQSTKFKNYYNATELSDQQIQKIESWTRKINLIMLAGVWCPDCARHCSIVQKIADQTDLIKVRYVDNRSNQQFADEFRINGAMKVPVLISLSEDFYEVSRYGDHHLSDYREKLKRLEGTSCSSGLIDPDEVARNTTEWLDHLERIQIILRLSPMLRRRYED